MHASRSGFHTSPMVMYFAYSPSTCAGSTRAGTSMPKRALPSCPAVSRVSYLMCTLQLRAIHSISSSSSPPGLSHQASNLVLRHRHPCFRPPASDTPTLYVLRSSSSYMYCAVHLEHMCSVAQPPLTPVVAAPGAAPLPCACGGCAAQHCWNPHVQYSTQPSLTLRHHRPPGLPPPQRLLWLPPSCPP